MEHTITHSTAIAQRCLFCGEQFPLYPPIPDGCPTCATENFRAPLDLVYDYPDTVDWLPASPLPGLTRYAPLLPPLYEHLTMGEGGTPLVRYPLNNGSAQIYIKDESSNPTWSHKDRLNICVISAALSVNAPGVVAASSGNHGASCAAYSARAGLPAIVLATPRPPAVASFLLAYEQTVVAVSSVEVRWTLMRHIIDELHYHPASNYTIPPTNHPFGSEGYKTIAYELYLQLDRQAPEAVFVPVGYAELTFGIYKGFVELARYGLIDVLPQIIGCEPAASGAPLAKAIAEGENIVHVNGSSTDAYAIAVPVNSYRGVAAIQGSEGQALALSESEMATARTMLAKSGMWAETSSAISFAGALKAEELGLGKRGPLVCINTSSGFKDVHVGEEQIPQIDGTWESLLELLNR